MIEHHKPPGDASSVSVVLDLVLLFARACCCSMPDFVNRDDRVSLMDIVPLAMCVSKSESHGLSGLSIFQYVEPPERGRS